jgi:MFS family permease
MAILEPKKIALLIAVLAGFLTPFDLSAVNIALPTQASEFSMDAVTMDWVATAYLLGSAVLLLPFGRLADIHGRKKIFSAGLMVFTFASFAMVFSVSPAMIISLRVVQARDPTPTRSLDQWQNHITAWRPAPWAQCGL